MQKLVENCSIWWQVNKFWRNLHHIFVWNLGLQGVPCICQQFCHLCFWFWRPTYFLLYSCWLAVGLSSMYPPSPMLPSLCPLLPSNIVMICNHALQKLFSFITHSHSLLHPPIPLLRLNNWHVIELQSPILFHNWHIIKLQPWIPFTDVNYPLSGTTITCTIPPTLIFPISLPLYLTLHSLSCTTLNCRNLRMYPN